MKKSLRRKVHLTNVVRVLPVVALELQFVVQRTPKVVGTMQSVSRNADLGREILSVVVPRQVMEFFTQINNW